MHVTIIGTGFVGVVTSAVLASFNHKVIGLDIDQKKVDSLAQGKVPFYEPGLEELLVEQQKSGNLRFTTEYEEAVSNADVVMVAVGTPSAADGTADLKFVLAACSSLAPHLKEDAVVVIKSTVPPGTLEKVDAVISPLTTNKYHLASVPEFLREGTAVHDTLRPDRVVLGVSSDFAFEVLQELHEKFNAPCIRVKPESAQMGKYTANAYLATRITFINQIANLCAKNGSDINEVIRVIGHDKRIGHHYWYPGLGYGGSCFPKDVKELSAYAQSIDETANLMVTINQLNEERIPQLMNEFDAYVHSFVGKKVAVLGLSFKPDTNDMREAPSTRVIPILLDKGATVVGYDPKSVEEAMHFLQTHERLSLSNSIEDAVTDADVIMVLIEWNEIISFDFAAHRLHKPQWFIDTRNQFNKADIESAGFAYLSIGR